MKHIGLIYSKGSKMLRRVVVADDDADKDSLRLHVGPGERLIITTDERLISDQGEPVQSRIEALIESETGVKPASHRCVVVDENGEVVGVIQADAEIDVIPGKVLVNHDHADVGWKQSKTDPKKFDGPVKAEKNA